MDAQSKFLIKITRYINPHIFFFKLEYNLSEFEKNIENILTIYGTSSRHNGYKGYAPSVGEIVVVFMQPWNKWIRAKCDYIAEFELSDPKFILWAMDDGVPFISAKRWIHSLPKNLLDIPAHSIFVGGLNNIIPMERLFNMDELRSENIAARDWTELAVKCVNDTINEAAEIWFKPEIKCGAYYFGSVTVKTFAGESVNLSMHLIEKDLANLSNNFGRDLTQIVTLTKSRWQKNNGVMDDIVENSRNHVERGCYRPANITHEIDVKFDDWTTQNERLRKLDETECNQRFHQVLDKLFNINLEVNDPFVPIEKRFNARYKTSFNNGGVNHNDRLRTLNGLKVRPPHRQSIDDYTSFTSRDRLDSIDRDTDDNYRCEVQSTMSTSTIFTNSKVFTRALQGLRMMQMEDSDNEDDDDDDAINHRIDALNTKANEPMKNPIVCIPSGHEKDLNVFQKINSNNNNNRFSGNKFNKQRTNEKRQIKK